jgi:hypothetical protein
MLIPTHFETRKKILLVNLINKNKPIYNIQARYPQKLPVLCIKIHVYFIYMYVHLLCILTLFICNLHYKYIGAGKDPNIIITICTVYQYIPS